jgi:hypothetical protein
MATPAEHLDRSDNGLKELLVQLDRPSIQPLSRVFLERALRAVSTLAERLQTQAIQKAVSEPSDYGVLLAALEAEPGLELVTRDDPLAEARLRGLRMKRELLAREGGILGAQEVADLLHVSRQAVHKRMRARRLIAVECGRHGYAYPAWQFVAGGLLPGLEETLAALDDALGPWMRLAFFLNDNVALDGDSPLEALRRGDREPVLRAAALYGQQGPS